MPPSRRNHPSESRRAEAAHGVKRQRPNAGAVDPEQLRHRTGGRDGAGAEHAGCQQLTVDAHRQRASECAVAKERMALALRVLEPEAEEPVGRRRVSDQLHRRISRHARHAGRRPELLDHVRFVGEQQVDGGVGVGHKPPHDAVDRRNGVRHRFEPERLPAHPLDHAVHPAPDDVKLSVVSAAHSPRGSASQMCAGRMRTCQVASYHCSG